MSGATSNGSTRAGGSSWAPSPFRGLPDVPRRRPHADTGRGPGREISARTGGLILAQLLFDITRVGGRADRVLDGPTNEVWIDPWVEHLRALGVDLRLDCPVQGLVLAGDRIAGVTTPTGTVTADFYVAALPVEIMRTLAGPPLRQLDPGFAGLDRFVTRWMNGVLFYLDQTSPSSTATRSTSIRRGH